MNSTATIRSAIHDILSPASVVTFLYLGAALISPTLAAAQSTDSTQSASLEALTRQVDFNIPQQSLASALMVFSDQAGIQVVSSGVDVIDAVTPGVQGKLPVSDALARLLRGTGLNYATLNDYTISIRPDATSTAVNAAQSIRLVQNDQPVAMNDGASPAEAARTEASARGSDQESIRLEEVVVTGSHIRGAQNLSSPVITFDRKDIEASGYATTQQLIQSLPQSLNSVSDMDVGGYSIGNPGLRTYRGSGVNLRGLGSDATLVLLNGRRLAAGGDGSFVDLSLIPLGAIERVDVLTDGASALYGSDAVGGVVNLILRKEFQGAETRLRYGSVTEGDHSELQAGQMLGRSWGSGQALITYEYFRRTELDRGDRGYYDPTVPLIESDSDLIPEQKRNGALVVLSQQLSDGVELSGELVYGRRESAGNYFNNSVELPRLSTSDVTQYGGSVGLSANVARDWRARLTALIDRNNSELQEIDSLSGAGAMMYDASRLSSLDLAADGTLLSLSGGEARLAFGGQVRKEQFDSTVMSLLMNTADPVRLERDVAAAYAELLVPFVGEQNHRTGIERLELTLAARYEDYSDFGETFNPKVGFAWSPSRGLNVRGTWGTSFKAPRLAQMAPLLNADILEGYLIDSTGRTTTALVLSGNGEDLGPEESKSWTMGFDFTPEAFDDLSLSVTYFDIDYDNRIRTPFPTDYDPAGVLLDPTYNRIVVTPQPSVEHVQLLLSNAASSTCFSYTAGGSCDPVEYASQVTAILDMRPRNLAGVRTSGVDWMLSYRLASDLGDWGLKLLGAHLLESRQRLVPSALETSELNLVYRPVDFRLRSNLSFTREGFNAVLGINYADDYRDNRPLWYAGSSVQRSRVASWTTVDLTLQYELGRLWGNSWLSATSLQLSATNLFDRKPPYIADRNALYYDGANANPIGRFLSAQITAQW